MTDPLALREFVPFRFVVTLYPEGGSTKNPLCAGAFSEVTGFEFTMTPKTIQEGGRNWGEVQLAGTTKFAPITLKQIMRCVSPAKLMCLIARWIATTKTLLNRC